MSKKRNVFSEEIKLSEIVLEKTNQAFEMIQQEGIVHMEKTNTR